MAARPPLVIAEGAIREMPAGDVVPIDDLPVGTTSTTVARGDAGVPTGGAGGAYLRKASATNYDESWVVHPSSGQASSTANATSTSTTYAAIANTGVVFTAPASGSVLVEASAGVLSGAANSGCHVAPIVRTGSTIGSGTVVLAAADANSVTNYGASTIDASRSTLLTGLTPGAVYHAQLAMRSNSSTTATSARQRCVVVPLLA